MALIKTTFYLLPLILALNACQNKDDLELKLEKSHVNKKVGSHLDTNDEDLQDNLNDHKNDDLENYLPLLQPPLKIDPAKSALNDCNSLKTYLGVNDPLACNVWHVVAYNQQIQKLPVMTSFHTTLPQKDFNLWDTYDHYTGANIKIHVTDSGLESTHDDIKNNYQLNSSRNYSVANPPESYNNQAPTPVSSHGTSVSGLIAAEANNNKGLFGVAYNAKISADNLISNGYVDTLEFLDAVKKDNSIDIWNGSFGVPMISGTSINYAYQVFSNSFFTAMDFGANTNNITYFKANGNDGNVRGSDGNLENTASFYMVNTVAALGSNNEVMYYSTPGANLALAGYANMGGGQLGTCTLGLTNTYVCSFNGTSSATPTVSGAAALVLEALKANPKVSQPRWNDVIWVLISTANKEVGQRQNHPNHYTGNIATQPREPIVTNSFGLTHSFDFGFGVPNIKEAILKAENLPESLGIIEETTEIQSSGSSQNINLNSCASQIVNMNDDFQIWSVRLSVKTTDSYVKDMAIFLKMPDGKVALVKNTLQDNIELIGGPSSLSFSQHFNVRAPMGLNAKGNWEVIVCNDGDENTTNPFGTYEGAKLKFYGFNELDKLR